VPSDVAREVYDSERYSPGALAIYGLRKE